MALEIKRRDLSGSYEPPAAELKQYPFIRTNHVWYPGNREVLYVSHIKNLPSSDLVMGGDEASWLMDLLDDETRLIDEGYSMPRQVPVVEHFDDEYTKILETLHRTPRVTPAGASLLGRAIMAGQQAVFSPELPVTADDDERKVVRELIIDAASASFHHLFMANRLLVAFFVKRMHVPSSEMSDAHAHGELGLAHATSIFDYRKGFRFGTYAEHLIRVNIAKRKGNLHTTESLNNHLSYDTDTELEEMIVGDDGSGMSTEVENNEAIERLARAMERLPRLHRQVFREASIRQHYDSTSGTLAEIGVELGIGEKTVSNLNLTARDMLLHPSSGLIGHNTSNPQTARLVNAWCLDEHISTFFPDTPNRGARERRETLCGGCAVKGPCEELAISRDVQYGYWGDAAVGNVAVSLKKAERRA